MLRITRSIIQDLASNWTLWLFAAFLMAVSFGLFQIETHPEKALIGILNSILLLIPAFSLIFSVIYYFNSADFITILLIQPIQRRSIITSFILALSTVFAIISLVGAGLPLLIYAPWQQAAIVLVNGVFLAVIFSGIGTLIAVYSNEKSNGLGLSLVLLFYFTLLFDGIILLFIYSFSEYPIEKPALYLTFLNPLDLSRIMTLMYTDAAALMGYTGAIFQQFFTATAGLFISIAVLTVWTIIPAFFAVRKFTKKKF